jgi:periplasmic divalent cation tolerance protein
MDEISIKSSLSKTVEKENHVLCVCISTYPNQTAAEEAAKMILNERLAACVSFIPQLTSYYVWNGALEKQEEVLVLIKTPAQLIKKLSEFAVKYHPYEIPEFVVIKADTFYEAYGRWVVDSTIVNKQ